MQLRLKLVAMSNRVVGELADALQPRLSTIETDLNSLDFMAAAVVRIPLHSACLPFASMRQWNLLTLRRFDNDAIQILLIARSIWVSEHSIRKISNLFSDE